LKKENAILKISNQTDLNTRVLSLEQRIMDAEADKDKFKAKVELKEQRIKDMENEIEFLRTQAEMQSD
jgi:hypothetical protein